jgi:hypothetical protein
MTNAELFTVLAQEHFIKLGSLSRRAADCVLMGQELAHGMEKEAMAAPLVKTVGTVGRALTRAPKVLKPGLTAASRPMSAPSLARGPVLATRPVAPAAPAPSLPRNPTPPRTAPAAGASAAPAAPARASRSGAASLTEDEAAAFARQLAAKRSVAPAMPRSSPSPIQSAQDAARYEGAAAAGSRARGSGSYSRSGAASLTEDEAAAFARQLAAKRSVAPATPAATSTPITAAPTVAPAAPAAAPRRLVGPEDYAALENVASGLPATEAAAGAAAQVPKRTPWLRMGLGGALATAPLAAGVGLMGLTSAGSRLVDQGTQPYVYGGGVPVGGSTF